MNTSTETTGDPGAESTVPAPDPEYSYGGFTVSITPIEGTHGRWRVSAGDSYFGEIAIADPVNGDVGVHFASHFAGEENIPPTTVDADWMKVVQFLIDAAA